ncbi:MAG: hypothetical protein MK132_09540 [Lentisphaerales bacterium]|nr:hypothetical protein [Lentisphaerales bacterium]
MGLDGAVVESSPQWDRCSPLRTGDWGCLDWWHHNSKVAMLFGDGHAESVDTFTTDKCLENPNDY